MVLSLSLRVSHYARHCIDVHDAGTIADP